MSLYKNIFVLSLVILSSNVFAEQKTKLSKTIERISDKISVCLAETSCSKNLDLLISLENNYFQRVNKHINTKPRQMQFEYDYQNYFFTIRSAIKNLDFPEPVRQILNSEYIKLIESETESLLKQAG